MPEQPVEPIPPDDAEAFANAVLRYFEWSPGEPECEVTIGRTRYPMTAVCGFVDKFTDQLPANVLNMLRSYMYDHPHGELITKLGADPTYATGARCLRRMIEMAVESHQRSEEWRRGRA
jgi:hypothetical protein